MKGWVNLITKKSDLQNLINRFPKTAAILGRIYRRLRKAL